MIKREPRGVSCCLPTLIWLTLIYAAELGQISNRQLPDIASLIYNTKRAAWTHTRLHQRITSQEEEPSWFTLWALDSPEQDFQSTGSMTSSSNVSEDL